MGFRAWNCGYAAQALAQLSNCMCPWLRTIWLDAYGSCRKAKARLLEEDDAKTLALEAHILSMSFLHPLRRIRSFALEKRD